MHRNVDSFCAVYDAAAMSSRKKPKCLALCMKGGIQIGVCEIFIRNTVLKYFWITMLNKVGQSMMS